MGPRDVERLLRRQSGVISRVQARSCGLTPRQLQCRLTSGEWIGVHPGVYRAASAVPTAEAALRAGALWVGDRGVLIGSGAGWWWEMLGDPPGRWQFSTGQRFTVPARPGLSVVRTFVDPRDTTTRLGVPVVTKPLAVLRSAVELERRRPGDGIALIDRAKQKHWASYDDLVRTYQRHRGTAGSRSMATLLERTGDRAHSELERAGVSRLRAAGITDFVMNYETILATGRQVELDVAFLRLRVGLEFDGFAYHSSPEQQRRDLQRANEIMASGWALRRFSWSDVLTDPDDFIRTVRSVLATREAIA